MFFTIESGGACGALIDVRGNARLLGGIELVSRGKEREERLPGGAGFHRHAIAEILIVDVCVHVVLVQFDLSRHSIHRRRPFSGWDRGFRAACAWPETANSLPCLPKCPKDRRSPAAADPGDALTQIPFVRAAKGASSLPRCGGQAPVREAAFPDSRWLLPPAGDRRNRAVLRRPLPA